MINVTRTYLPSFEDYCKMIKPLWETRWLTNRGSFAIELENKLKEKLEVNHLLYVNNGMVALQIAIKALGIKGDVITTPFSYVATTGAILWEGCNPVFVDIEDQTYCIDADKIEAAITPETTAIIATHVFGFPCNIEKIRAIAEKHQLKVIYDGAHAFNTFYNGKSIFSYGDISICSFHATKLFHTVEGGAIICNNKELEEKVLLYHQFGHLFDDYKEMGINAKVSELHAAMGLCVFPLIDEIIEKRKVVFDLYKNKLESLNLKFPLPSTFEGYNYAYFPVVFDSEETVLKIKQSLQESEIFSRRYFYPSLNKLSYIKKDQSCPISETIAECILCLPFYPELNSNEIEQITSIIINSIE
jgi:dTDP-4-amino-4,6-dideoxygalactose transaminase